MTIQEAIEFVSCAHITSIELTPYVVQVSYQSSRPYQEILTYHYIATYCIISGRFCT